MEFNERMSLTHRNCKEIHRKLNCIRSLFTLIRKECDFYAFYYNYERPSITSCNCDSSIQINRAETRFSKK